MIPEDMLNVLLVEDNPGDVELVRLFLAQEPRNSIALSHVPSLRAAREAMGPGLVDLVLLDLGLPDGTGIEVVGAIRQMAPNVPIVVLTGLGDSDSGLEALKRDAQDYLVKDQLDAPTLRRSIEYTMERHRWQQHYRRQLSVSPDGVIVLNELGRVCFVNAAASQMLGGAPNNVEVLPEAIRLARGAASDVELDTGRVVEARSVETEWQGEPACLVTLRDMTERRRAEEALARLTDELRHANERLEALVSTDHLTEVLNRRGIETALGTELRRLSRTGESLVAVLIDYDDFKDINDSYGYAVGDAALRALMQSVRGALRAGDHIGRVGGDEFLVLLPGATLQTGLAVAEKLRRKIKTTPLPVADVSVSLSASLAVGVVESHVVSVEEVLASVNRSLKVSKDGGKDRVFGHPGDTAQGGDGTALAELLAADFDATSIELEVVLQAIRRVDTESVVGYEALTRGPQGAFSMPADLFRAAFERNVLTTLDLRALSACLGLLRSPTVRGRLHVNLFPSTILNVPIDRIIGLIDEAEGADRICVELSEQQFLGDPTYLREPLTALRESGTRVAIDDVGFGRSSIEALLVLEPDVVKVDRTCVRDVDNDPERCSLLARLVDVLGVIGTEVVVEGIETEGELEVLRELGVPYGQGFLWGRPGKSSAG